ncbi:8750_t:CDS:2, partial [Ambispora gerdemannii]
MQTKIIICHTYYLSQEILQKAKENGIKIDLDDHIHEQEIEAYIHDGTTYQLRYRIIEQIKIQFVCEIQYEKLKSFFQIDGTNILKLYLKNYIHEWINYHQHRIPASEDSQRSIFYHIKRKCPVEARDHFLNEYLRQLNKDIYYFREQYIQPIYDNTATELFEIKKQQRNESSLFASSSEGSNKDINEEQFDHELTTLIERISTPIISQEIFDQSNDSLENLSKFDKFAKKNAELIVRIQNEINKLKAMTTFNQTDEWENPFVREEIGFRTEEEENNQCFQQSSFAKEANQESRLSDSESIDKPSKQTSSKEKQKYQEESSKKNNKKHNKNSKNSPPDSGSDSSDTDKLRKFSIPKFSQNVPTNATHILKEHKIPLFYEDDDEEDPTEWLQDLIKVLQLVGLDKKLQKKVFSTRINTLTEAYKKAKETKIMLIYNDFTTSVNAVLDDEMENADRRRIKYLEKTIQILVAEQKENQHIERPTDDKKKCHYCGRKEHLMRESTSRITQRTYLNIEPTEDDSTIEESDKGSETETEESNNNSIMAL